jgi:predicted neutral ceramidase superfamily lipid hydrolase
MVNWIESLALLFADRWIRELLGEKPLTNPEYLQLFVALVFVIGIGYWWVSQDISRNREIVKLGIYAQSSVFVVLAYQTLVGNVHPFYLIPGVIDLILAILFGLFLYSYAQTKPTFE